MTFLADSKNYTHSGFRSLVESLRWTSWHPKGITLHNTGAPSLGQWIAGGLDSREKRLSNIDAMYRNRHWHSAVHLFIGPADDDIWNCCDLRADGVACTCTNHTDIQIEMLGNFASPNEHWLGMPSADNWASIEAQKVRDNTAFVLAVLYKQLGISPETLRFHRDCFKDHHACPGGQVSKLDMVARVKACGEMLK
jgi:hypothetical protein